MGIPKGVQTIGLMSIFLTPGVILVIRLVRTEGVMVVKMMKHSEQNTAQHDLDQHLMSQLRPSEQESENKP